MNKQLLFVMLLGFSGISLLSARVVTVVNDWDRDVIAKLTVRAEGDNGDVVIGRICTDVIPVGHSVRVDLINAKTSKKTHDGKMVGEVLRSIDDLSVTGVRVVNPTKVGKHVRTHEAHHRTEHARTHRGYGYPALCHSPWRHEAIKHANIINIAPLAKESSRCTVKAVKVMKKGE